MILPPRKEVMGMQVDEREALLARAATAGVAAEDVDLIRAIFDSYAYVTALIEQKNQPPSRLRPINFGSRTEELANLLSEPAARRQGDWRAVLVLSYVLAASIAVTGLLLMPGLSDQLLYAVTRDQMSFRKYSGEVAAHRSQRVASSTLVILGHSIGRHLDHRRFWSGPGLNYSIGGDTLVGLMDRAGTYELEGAAAIVVMIGINDVSKADNDEVVSGFRRLLTQLPATKVLLCAILPVDEARVPRSFTGFLRGIRTTNQRIRSINTRIAGLCEDFPHVNWFDPGEELCDAQGALASEFTQDGVHLNPDGYKLVENRLRHVIQNAGLPASK